MLVKVATDILARITHIYGEAPLRDFGSDTLNYFIADARNHDDQVMNHFIIEN